MAKVEKAICFIFMSSHAEMRFLVPKNREKVAK
jgi:hypothetical protein